MLPRVLRAIMIFVVEPYSTYVLPARAMLTKGGRVSGSAGRHPKPSNPTLGRGKAPAVLIVGEMRELLLYRAEVLRHSGFRVITPENKKEAIEAIQRGGFDVAVLSYTLSSDTVEELAERIRQNSPECPVISIARSGAVDRRLHPDEVAVGEEGPPALLAALERALRKRTH